MDTPDVTKAQIIALMQAVIGTAVAFGAPISDAQSVALLALVAVVAAFLTHSDAKIRVGRSNASALQPADETPVATTIGGE
jgi:hypothetical protein